MKIIERRLPIHHFLVRSIFGDVSAYNSSQAYCEIVYFDENDPKVITANLVYVEDKEFMPFGFINLIEEDLTFDECLIMTTLYFNQPEKIIKRIICGSVIPTDDHLSHILNCTKGFLLFSFQFEQLAMMILDVPLDEAIRIRKTYNKHQSLINFSNRDDYRLRQFKTIVQERAITKVVNRPNYKGAKNLYQFAQTVI